MFQVSSDHDMTSFSLLGEYSNPDVKSEDDSKNECFSEIK